jgi:hypothetical protein
LRQWALVSAWDGHRIAVTEASGIRPDPRRRARGGNHEARRPSSSEDIRFVLRQPDVSTTMLPSMRRSA